jgi:cytochrome b involved in lipid metabolism
MNTGQKTNKTYKKNHNNNTKPIYDLVIIGGGISGLYTLYKLGKKYPRLKILLLESNERYGGRIYSYKESIDGQEYIMDLGAGRLGHHHTLINNLINELNLKDKIITIPNTKTYIEVTKKNNKTFVSDKTTTKDYIMEKLNKFLFSPFVSKLGKSVLQTFYISDLIKKYLSVSFSQKVESVFEYSSDLNDFNAYDAIEYFKYDYNKDTTFFTLKGGLLQIIEGLLVAIKKLPSYKSHNIRLANLSNVENVTRNTNTNLFKLSITDYKKSKNYTINSKYLICAIPKNSLERLDIFKPFLRDLNSINNINLLRIYEIYDTKNGDAWFKPIGKTITNSEVQFIIPINPNNGLIMSSYSDCANAKYWNLLLAKKGIDSVKNKLNEKLNELFSIYNITVPTSKYIKMYYWDAGVAYWKKNVDSEYLSSKLLNLVPGVFIIGENYSNYQAWCEGALMTSENCIVKLSEELDATGLTNKQTRKQGGRSGPKKFTMQEVKKHNKKSDAWLLINNKVYNVTNWIDKHPGGKIIMKGVGKDATQLFLHYKHPSFVKESILPKYYIGDLAK